MDRIEDPALEKDVLAIIHQLCVPEAAAKIDIIIVKEMPGLGLTLIYNDKERHWGSCKSYSHILENIRVKTMLQNQEEKDIVYAILAHEVGNAMTCKDIYFEGEEKQAFILEWEIEADEKALMLLENIYDNPKEILLKQINYVRNKCGDIDKVDIRLTMELAEKRENALLKK